MKSSEIHNGLDKKEIRDFLSIAVVKNFESEIGHKKPIIPYREGNSFEWAIKDTENEIIYYQRKLECLKERQAIAKMIKMNNWNEFNVSEETINDTGYKLHMNFLGTQSEYDNLINTLKKKV